MQVFKIQMNAGWINFNSTHSQITINASTGEFDGYTWSENFGWVHFQNASPTYKVQTNWPTITWDGSSSTDWGATANWDSNIVPSNTNNVVIPDASTTPNDPAVSSGAVASNLTIQSGGILSGSSNTLSLSGNWSNSGTFTHNSGTVTLNGSTDQALATANQTFYNLTLNNTGTDGNDDIVVSGNLDVNGKLTITNGDLDCNANNPNLFLSGDFEIGASGTFTKGTGILTFDGSTAFTDNTSPKQNLGTVKVD